MAEKRKPILTGVLGHDLTHPARPASPGPPWR